MGIIIRTRKNSVLDTSKQRVIDDCCSRKQLESVQITALLIRIRCANCGEIIVDIIS